MSMGSQFPPQHSVILCRDMTYANFRNESHGLDITSHILISHDNR